MKKNIVKILSFIFALVLLLPLCIVTEGVSYKPGDVNEDGVIDESDAVLLGRYLAGWAVLIDKTSADTNASDSINESDAVLLGRFLGGWKIDLKSQKLLTLTDNGSSDYVIVRGKDAYISEVTASTELQSYLEKISGVKLPIVTDDTEPKDKEIVVGKTNREPDGFVKRGKLGDDGLLIATVGEKLFLTGAERRGTLFAVYEFLDKYLGCRFYTDVFEKIPEQDRIIFPAEIYDEQIPVFEYRDSDSTTGITRVNAKMKMNGCHAGSWESAKGGNVHYAGRDCHTLFFLVPPETLGEEHPEYFTWENGVAQEVCLTNPEVLEIAIDSVRKILKTDPDARLISVTQLDNENPCMCENCRKVFLEEGTHSGAFIRFVNAIADDIKEDFPNVLVDTFAYRYTRQPPAKADPRDNVVVRYCPFETCLSHSIEECGRDVFREGYDAYEELKAWSSVAENMYIWDYACNFEDNVQPFGNFTALRKNIRMYAELGVDGVFEESSTHKNNIWSEFGVLRQYLIARLLWDPYMSEAQYNEYMWEFLRDVYGDGWTYLKQFIDLSESTMKDTHVCCLGCYASRIYPATTKTHSNPLPKNLTYDMVKNYESTDWTQFLGYFVEVVPHPLYEKGLELFEKAMAVATPEQKERLKVTMTQVEYIGSVSEYKRVETVKTDIAKLISDYFAETGNAVPGGKAVAFRNSVVAVATEQARQKYKEFNEALIEKLYSFGIDNLGYLGIRISTIDHDSLINAPEHWENRAVPN